MAPSLPPIHTLLLYMISQPASQAGRNRDLLARWDAFSRVSSRWMWVVFPYTVTNRDLHSHITVHHVAVIQITCQIHLPDSGAATPGLKFC